MQRPGVENHALYREMDFIGADYRKPIWYANALARYPHFLTPQFCVKRSAEGNRDNAHGYLLPETVRFSHGENGRPGLSLRQAYAIHQRQQQKAAAAALRKLNAPHDAALALSCPPTRQGLAVSC